MDNVKMLPRCKVKKRRNTKKTQKEYVSELAYKNPNVIVLDNYINANTPIKHYCKIHNIEFNIRPISALYGCGCHLCTNKKRNINQTRTHEQYLEEVAIKNPNIEVIGTYITARTAIEHRCKKHNVVWNTSPYSILRGVGCYKCSSEKIRNKLVKSDSQYINELKEINPNIKVVEEYKNSLTPILHKCLVCNCEWKGTPANILAGSGCPKCKNSRGEKEIISWLDEHNIDYIRQKNFSDCRDTRPLPFDFYLPSMNICIEYDGEQHFRSVDWFGGEKALKQRILHDNIKDEYCRKNNILLFRISYRQNVDEELNNFLFI